MALGLLLCFGNMGIPLALCSASLLPPPEKACLLILVLICLSVSVTKMALLGKDALILPLSPCKHKQICKTEDSQVSNSQVVEMLGPLPHTSAWHCQDRFSHILVRLSTHLQSWEEAGLY